MGILGSLVVLEIGLGISILVSVVMRSLRVEYVSILVLILFLWLWGGLVMGILRRWSYLGVVVLRKGWDSVRGEGILRILHSQFYY